MGRKEKNLLLGESEQFENKRKIESDPFRQKGLILKNYAGYYYVQTSAGDLIECRIRGKMKEPLLTGDWVEMTVLKNQRGVIEKRLPRKNQLYRPRIANSSLVLIVLAQNHPKPDLMMLDRLLLLVYYCGLKPCIVLNKSDLEASDTAAQIRSYYAACGIRVIAVSAKEKEGIAELQEVIKGEIAVLAGPSGVGKTSLLNQLIPGKDERTQTVSAKIGRGRHTTRHVELYPLPSGGWLADTPGFSVMELPGMPREELRNYFPDFRVWQQECRFRDCLHYKEQDCAVIEAVQEGKILELRHHDYVLMLEEIIEKERNY